MVYLFINIYNIDYLIAKLTFSRCEFHHTDIPEMNKESFGKIFVHWSQDKVWPYAKLMKKSQHAPDKDPVNTLCDCTGGVCSLIVIMFSVLNKKSPSSVSSESKHEPEGTQPISTSVAQPVCYIIGMRCIVGMSRCWIMHRRPAHFPWMREGKKDKRVQTSVQSINIIVLVAGWPKQE